MSHAKRIDEDRQAVKKIGRRRYEKEPRGYRANWSAPAVGRARPDQALHHRTGRTGAETVAFTNQGSSRKLPRRWSGFSFRTGILESGSA
jgi:hypothetical protein